MNINPKHGYLLNGGKKTKIQHYKCMKIILHQMKPQIQLIPFQERVLAFKFDFIISVFQLKIINLIILAPISFAEINPMFIYNIDLSHQPVLKTIIYNDRFLKYIDLLSSQYKKTSIILYVDINENYDRNTYIFKEILYRTKL